jgi:hypothetical protein
LAVRNKAYFTKNGDADWRELLPAFSTVSVKVADGGDWESYQKYAAPLVEAARAAGCEVMAWHYVYFSPWRAAGYGALEPGSYKVAWPPKYRGLVRDAKRRNFRRFRDTAEQSAEWEAQAAARGMAALGIRSMCINAEAAAFGTANAAPKGGAPQDPDGYYLVTNWPEPGGKGGINGPTQVYCDTLRAAIPGAEILWNGFSTKSFTPLTAARMDGWLPMRYMTSSGGIRRGWESAQDSSPGLPWGVMTGAKAPYFPKAFFGAVEKHRPDSVAFFYGPGSRLGPTVDAAGQVSALLQGKEGGA